jgi:hypothetical protein
MGIEQRIKYHKYLLVSKCLKNEAPIYLNNKIQYLSDRNPYSLRNVVSEKLQIPKVKSDFFKKTFAYSGPMLWIELPFSIRQASSHNAFKTKVKSFILKEEILKCIKKLKNNKACGEVLVINEYIKSTTNTFIDIYEQLFNIIFETGIVPDNWLMGNIKPIYKTKVIKWIQKIIGQLQYLAVSENFLPQS